MANYITPGIKRLQDQAIGYQDPFSSIDLSGIDPKYMQSNVSMNKEPPKGFMENVKAILGNNPQIAQYLLGMGAGMAQGSVGNSFGGALAQGFGTAGQYAAQDVERQNTAADDMKRFFIQQSLEGKRQQALIDYKESKDTAKQQDDSAAMASSVSDMFQGQKIPPEAIKLVNTILSPKAPYEIKKTAYGQLIDQQKLTEPTYASFTTPGGENKAFNTKNPNDVRDIGATSSAPVQQNIPTSPAISTQISPIAAPPGWTSKTSSPAVTAPPGSSPKTVQRAEELNLEMQQKQGEEQVKAAAKQHEADVALMGVDPTKTAKYTEQIGNMSDLNRNLNIVQNKYGEHWYTNNQPFLEVASKFDKDVANVTQNQGQIMVDVIKNFKEVNGVAPTQLMNTEKEWERQKEAAVGGGPVESQLEANKKLMRAFKLDMAGYEEQRKTAAGRLGVDYKPLIPSHLLPNFENSLPAKTGDKPIGSEWVVNGKRYRVVGQDKLIEVR